MVKIWDIKLYQTKKGYKVIIKGSDPELGINQCVDMEAPTPQQAYDWCTNRLTVKPWLVNAE